MGGLGGIRVVMFGRWVVWDGVGLVLGGTFCWFTVVRTGFVESKGLGWYSVGLGNKWVVWVVSVWFGVVCGLGYYLASVGDIGLVCGVKRFGVVLGRFSW